MMDQHLIQGGGGGEILLSCFGLWKPDTSAGHRLNPTENNTKCSQEPVAQPTEMFIPSNNQVDPP